ncbi:hypothetical protein GGR88_000073 [Sphingomonas jejuensis]|uniref:Secreted protein n=1 Tax=Sphingomonas jejuensis TaxID=904715 RepID=A0ABX0XHB3_9SPHN|nr:hypothetical protein [Sphingomonas jejuensis]NJC32599.1 hypothetical protein [Sphingomonas jejuensis]
MLLLVAAPAVDAFACGPEPIAATACQDCDAATAPAEQPSERNQEPHGACLHGHCHHPHTGLRDEDPASDVVFDRDLPFAWTNVNSALGLPTSGPERPPRS